MATLHQMLAARLRQRNPQAYMLNQGGGGGPTMAPIQGLTPEETMRLVEPGFGGNIGAITQPQMGGNIPPSQAPFTGGNQPAFPMMGTGGNQTAFQTTQMGGRFPQWQGMQTGGASQFFPQQQGGFMTGGNQQPGFGGNFGRLLQGGPRRRGGGMYEP